VPGEALLLIVAVPLGLFYREPLDGSLERARHDHYRNTPESTIAFEALDGHGHVIGTSEPTQV
jgi:hypothetical protein